MGSFGWTVQEWIPVSVCVRRRSEKGPETLFKFLVGRKPENPVFGEKKTEDWFPAH